MSSSIIFALIAFLCSFICGYITIPMVLNFCKRYGLYDIPNTRKIHNNAIPRLGGIVFLPCVFIGCIIVFAITQLQGEQTITFSLWTVYFTIGLVAIYITGIIDDIIGLEAFKKLTVQLVASCVMPASGLYINNLYGLCGIYEIPFTAGFLLTIIVMAFISNAINLIDGIDGQASGLTIIALCGFIYAFDKWGLWFYVIMIAALVGVLLAYTYFNLFGKVECNRKIFMGDTGSLSIGFLLAFLSLKLTMKNPNLSIYDGNGLLLSYTVLIVPVFDAIRVALVRIRHRRSPVAPDKNHIHHKLMRAGLSQHRTLCVVVGLAVFYIALNCLLNLFTDITMIVIINIVVYVIFHKVIDRIIISHGQKTEVF
ncbi:MAG: glycosyltransferase family 4 protein [Prevotella sp.]